MIATTALPLPLCRRAVVRQSAFEAGYDVFLCEFLSYAIPGHPPTGLE